MDRVPPHPPAAASLIRMGEGGRHAATRNSMPTRVGVAPTSSSAGSNYAPRWIIATGGRLRRQTKDFATSPPDRERLIRLSRNVLHSDSGIALDGATDTGSGSPCRGARSWMVVELVALRNVDGNDHPSHREWDSEQVVLGLCSVLRRWSPRRICVPGGCRRDARLLQFVHGPPLARGSRDASGISCDASRSWCQSTRSISKSPGAGAVAFGLARAGGLVGLWGCLGIWLRYPVHLLGSSCRSPCLPVHGIRRARSRFRAGAGIRKSHRALPGTGHGLL